MTITKRISEILQRCEAATPGPYVLDYYNENWANVWPQNGPVKTSKPVMIAKGVKRENAEFFQCARSDLPLVTQALMKAVEGLKAVEEEMNMLACIPEYDGEDANIARVSINKITSTIAEIEKLLEGKN